MPDGLLPPRHNCFQSQQRRLKRRKVKDAARVADLAMNMSAGRALGAAAGGAYANFGQSNVAALAEAFGHRGVHLGEPGYVNPMLMGAALKGRGLWAATDAMTDKERAWFLSNMNSISTQRKMMGLDGALDRNFGTMGGYRGALSGAGGMPGGQPGGLEEAGAATNGAFLDEAPHFPQLGRGGNPAELAGAEPHGFSGDATYGGRSDLFSGRNIGSGGDGAGASRAGGGGGDRVLTPVQQQSMWEEMRNNAIRNNAMREQQLAILAGSGYGGGLIPPANPSSVSNRQQLLQHLQELIGPNGRARDKAREFRNQGLGIGV